jgi:hypothetical protein
MLQQCVNLPNQHGKIGMGKTHVRGRNTMVFDIRWNMLVMRMGTLCPRVIPMVWLVVYTAMV